MTPTAPPDPFSKEGAARIAQITGQKLASTPIDASLIGNTPSITVPPPAPPPLIHPSTIVLPPIQNTAAQDTLNAEKDTLIGDINADTSKLGTKSAEQVKLEAEQGIPQLNKDIQELYDQANQIDAQSVQAKANSEDRLAPTFAITGEQASIDRQAAARKAGIAAIATAKQGKLALAQDYVTKALAAEFDPVEKEIEQKKFLLTVNMDSFNTEEKRRAEAQQIALDQQKQQLQDTKDAKAQIYQTSTIAAKYNAPNAILQAIQAASSPEQALIIAAPYLQDPMAKYELESARLDNILKKAQITKTQAETAQIGQPTVTETKAAIAAQQAAQAAVPVAKDKLTLIKNLISSPGLAGAVGPNPIARSAPDFNAFTGVRGDFIAGINQLTNQETLSELIALKAQGGTLGALSDSEGAMLRQAASKIGTWAVHNSNGDVVGYKTSEASFKAELETIRTLTQRALDKAVGGAGLVSPDEQSAIQQFLKTESGSTPATINPASYY